MKKERYEDKSYNKKTDKTKITQEAMFEIDDFYYEKEYRRKKREISQKKKKEKRRKEDRWN